MLLRSFKKFQFDDALMFVAIVRTGLSSQWRPHTRYTESLFTAQDEVLPLNDSLTELIAVIHVYDHRHSSPITMGKQLRCGDSGWSDAVGNPSNAGRLEMGLCDGSLQSDLCLVLQILTPHPLRQHDVSQPSPG